MSICSAVLPSPEPRPIDQVAGFRGRVHDPVLPAIEVEILVGSAIENPWFAVLQEVMGEPEEFFGIIAIHLQAIEMRDIRHGLGEYPFLLRDEAAGSFRVGNHFRFSLKISGMNEIAQSK